MSKQASKTLIGAFVLGAIALAVVAVVIFGSGRFFKKTYKYVLFFEGSVKGLQVGAPVMFKGVKLGQVTGIVMHFDPSDLAIHIPVYVELQSDIVVLPETFPLLKHKRDQYAYLEELIRKGLRAQLQMQSFVTGLLMINLDFYPDKPARLVGLEKKYHEIPTIPSSMQEMTKKIEELPLNEIAESLKGALSGIEKLVNSPDVQGSVSSLNQALKDFDKLVRDVNAQVVPLASDMDKLVKNVDAQVVPLAASLKKTSDAAQAAFVQAEKTLAMQEGVPGQIASGIKDTLSSARSTLEETQKAVRKIDDLVAQNARLGYQVSKTLEDISSLSRSLRSLADYLERHPEAFIKGKKPSKGE